ncbi:MAG: serine/threonine protein kinase [Anaerolineales bacterium]|nr:serine/threonine protein kinase [Anaerolineales bacterium]
MNNLQPGQMLGPYRIINQVGQGGMATVYKAYQPSMDRNVAVKVLPSQLAESKEFTKRFQQEAHIIARLEHAHILPVFDYGKSEGISYFVMRYLEAGTLKDKMEAGRPLPLKQIDRIFTQLTDALSYAHSQGVIHRDLKPANALIDSQGNLFLTDFGIAKILASASPRLTQTDAIMGTPAYISPEQAQALTVDQRSDIYSLGIILYEMVTGRVPFVADTPLAVILKHVSDPMPLPSTVKADIPESIERVILKALAKNPDDRFANMAEFVDAWKNALDGSPSSVSHISTSPVQTQLKPASVSTTVPKPGRSKGWAVGCLAGTCLLFTVAGVFFISRNWQNLPFINSGNAPSFPSGDVVTEEFETEIGDEISDGEPDSGAGLIEAPGSKDIYTFSAEAGQEVYVHIIQQPEVSDNIDFYMTDDLGSNVFYSCMQCGDPGVLTLDRGGTYTLTVGNDEPDGAGYGAYRIKLWELSPPDEFSINLEDRIARGIPGEGAGYIENPGSKDIYTFTIDSGQDVYFQVKEQPQTNDEIYWRVEDEQENEFFSTCLQCGDPGLVTLDGAGTYNVIVGNDSGAGTGSYEIRMWSVPPPDEFTVEIGERIAKDIPGPGAASIELPGSHDIYTFTATAGQEVTFAVIEQLPNSDSIEWLLVDEDGNEVFNTCLSCGDPGSITLDRGGSYTMIVGSNTNPATGAYELQVSSP